MGLLILRFVTDLRQTRKGRNALRCLLVAGVVLAVLVAISFARM